jgi:predicted RNase H-like HicB family nuclease
MIDLRYSLVTDATEDPNFSGFYSPELEGFTGIGHSAEDCIYKARCGMEEHIRMLKEEGIPIPREGENPMVIIQNEKKVAQCNL